MYDYKAPLRDIQFSMEDVFSYQKHYSQLYGEELVSQDLVQAILNEYSKFCENELVPIYHSADEQGCQFDNGVVTTPDGFKAAYHQLAEGGWTSLTSNVEFGGQGLPSSLGKIIGELTCSANTSFALYTSGQSGAIETIAKFGTDEQRSLYESRLIDGSWNATMCLTEPHCGTDLGLLRTKAVVKDDGSYAISGTKIFITGGEHDLTDNIIHLVLARLEDAPEGVKGISLFIVPKQITDSDGNIQQRNTVTCGSIEHKMGVKGSATCVLNFEEAQGFMLGTANRGLHAMFTFVNASRTSAAMQGVSHSELGFQKSLAYAQERLQMRALSGAKTPENPADPIIVHPDVRRMLMTQKAFTEGNRMMMHYIARYLDIAKDAASERERMAASRTLDFMTPIAKAFATETGFECANLAIQCFGGHGYIRETGIEQNLRDCRISTLYEGTTGIQALDLINRKVLASNGQLLEAFISEIIQFCEEHSAVKGISNYVTKLRELCQEWQDITLEIAAKARQDLDETGAASVNYLMYSGYIALAYFWTKACVVAVTRLCHITDDTDFYLAKLSTAKFYFHHLLPRSRSCVESIRAGAESMMELPEQHFAF